MESMEPKAMPIAVIGLGCRFPGDATNGDKLWNFLSEKRSARSDVPSNRYNVDAFYHPDGDRYGTTNNRGGHYLVEDVSLFDAPFFSVSPAEAMAMDPMQRLLLEVTYEALENSGLPMSKVSGSNTSCFVGCFTKDYEEMQRRDMELAPKYQSTGASQTMLSNRLSYFFDLKGPSISLDTACSSGLVAVHLACQSLRTGESTMAIAGGSNLILSPDIQIEMSDMHFLSPDSISYSFDERANGYARGEGIGAVILKPLDLALRDNDPIRAVIRGTASSSDGRTPGITMPSKQAQVDLIRAAYNNAGCDISETGYFEAHGTGTAAGDPIETGAIGEVFARRRPLAENGDPIPLAIGSLKTNLGHLEGASGIAGLIKAILSVEKGIIAPNIWFQRGNPAIDFHSWRLRVPTEVIDWPLRGLRRASINSFGYGGTNAHVVLDDAQHYLQHHRKSAGRSRTDSGFASSTSDTANDVGNKHRIFVLSANDEHSLLSAGRTLAEHLRSHSISDEETFLDNLVFTLNERRSMFPFVSTVVSKGRTDLESKLCNLSPISRTHKTPPGVGFIFTGQGAQWWRMGRELLDYSIFKNSLRRCDAVLQRLGARWSLIDELLKDQDASRVQEATYSQPLCTALQIALVDLLSSCNIHPRHVVGHSSGEIAAAYAAGALELNAAVKIAYYRGYLSAKIKNLGYQGRMMAVGMSEQAAIDEIEHLGSDLGKVVIACINSPCSVTLSGDAPAIEALQKTLDDRGVFVRLLQVHTAYHSHHMQAIADEYRACLQDSEVQTSANVRNVTMFSSVTENIVEQSQLGPQYWVSNLIGTVRFSGALSKLCLSGDIDILLEVGPHALLKLPTREILEAIFEQDSRIQYIPTLLRNKAADSCLLDAASELFGRNYSVDLHNINFPTEPKRALSVLTNLPQYQWNHTRRYWCESRLSRDYRFRRSARTDILGAPVHDWNPVEPRFRNFLRLREQPWLKDHVVQGDILFPACGYICMAIEACRQMVVMASSFFLPHSSSIAEEYRLRQINISRALVVPDTDEGIETCFSMRCKSNDGTAGSEAWHEFSIFSYTVEGGWAENCRGLVSVSIKSSADDELARSCLRDWTKGRCSNLISVNPEVFYEHSEALGLAYGPSFQGLKEIIINDRQPNVSNQATGIIEVTDTCATNSKDFEHKRLLHPATLDSFLQLALAALGGEDLSQLQGAMVPTFFEEICISANIAAQIGDKLHVHVATERYSTRGAKGNIFALDSKTSKPVVLLDGFQFVSLNGPKEIQTLTSVSKHCYLPTWEPDVELIDRRGLDHELQTAPRQDDQPKRIRELELLSYYFLNQALAEVTEIELQAMLPHHQKFYKNLCKLRDAVQTKAHPQQTDEWRQIHSPEVTKKLQSMVEHYRNHESAYDGKLLVRVGEALPSIFRKEVEPLALMTHENLLEDYYTTAVGMLNTYAQITRYVTMLSHKNPNLEYLEIGAGTGGATVPTLKGLCGNGTNETSPRLKSYTYTDISSYFFQRAAEKFENVLKFMDFKKLDIERDFEPQGFGPASYDVIIAANVLHATSDMHRTMTQARKLLRPGGKLILLEMTNRLLAASVIFGTLPGWWNASEEWRTEGPLLTEAQWEETLLATGFSKLQASSPDVKNPLEEGTRLMIATAVEPRTMPDNGLPTPPEHHLITILCTDSPVKINRLDTPIALKTRFENAGLQAQIKPLSKVNKEDITGAVCISFVELEEPLLAEPRESAFEIIRAIAETSAGLIWVTRGATSQSGEHPELAVFQGLARTLRVEYESFPCITVDLDDDEKLHTSGVADLLLNVHNQKFRHSSVLAPIDAEFIEKRGVLHIKRVYEDAHSNHFLTARTDPAALPPQLESIVQTDRPLRLRNVEVASSTAFVFEDDARFSKALKLGEIEISVQSTTLSRRDTKMLNGEIPVSSLGQECAGIISRIGGSISHLSVGDHVVAWCTGTFATHVRTSAAFAYKIPETMDWDSATTLPLSYCTAYHSLVKIARVEAGETVLIHQATTAVGQAAIQIASKLGLSIFVTTDAWAEAATLSQTYSIEASRILSSHDISFVTALRRATGGRGVDVVLNTLSGELLQATFSCVAPFGRFIDLRENTMRSNEKLEMAQFQRNVSFSSVDLGMLQAQKPKRASELFRATMQFVADHKLTATSSLQTQPYSKLAEAVSIVHSRQHENVVLLCTPNDKVLVAQTPPKETSLDPNASYLLSGGLGGLGRSIAQWFVDHGAKNLIFVSRSGAKSHEATLFVDSLNALGIRTAVLKCDISDALALSDSLVSTLSTFPPIRGVIQGAMTLNDSLFANMTHSQWTSTILPKVHGSKNLHEATFSQPLDFFILLSSLHSFIGNPGQANYAAGCAYQVALANYRTSIGLPATAIDLGIVSDVGYVVEHKDSGKKIHVQNFKHINEEEMLALIELGIREPFKTHLVTGLDSDMDITTLGHGVPFFARNPVLSHLDYLRPHLRTQHAEQAANASTPTVNVSLSTQLSNAGDAAEKESVLRVALLRKLSKSLMMDVSELDASKSMSSYGTDSLVAVEMKNWVQREAKVTVSVFDILQSASIDALVGKIAERVGAGNERGKVVNGA
ncbi:hypothetical protein ACN47E_009916 [Coniothyrium glycines]